MSDRKIKKYEDLDPNFWLLEKRKLRLGDPHFVPKSYWVLGEFWGYLTKDQLWEAETYSQFRLLVQKCQGITVVWTRQRNIACDRMHFLSEEEVIHIEQKWRSMVLQLSGEEIALLDYLSLSPVDEGISSKYLQKLIRKGLDTLDKVLYLTRV